MTSLWRNQQYVVWLIGDTGRGLAQSLVAFAIPLLALIVTDSPTQAGIIGAVSMTLRVILTPFGGVLADRHPRIRLMVIGSLIGAALALLFTVLALDDALDFGTLLAIDALLAVRGGLFDTAGETALKDIVDGRVMGRAQAANQARDAVLRLGGEPIGGVLLVLGGWLIGLAMAICQLVAAVAGWLISRMRVADAAAGSRARLRTAVESRTAAMSDAAKPDVLREIREGFAWLLSRRDLRGVLLVMTLVNLGLNTVLTTIIYALQQHGESPATIGLMSAGMGVAMLVGAVSATLVVTRVGTGALLVTGLVALAFGSAALAWVREPLWIVLVMAVPCVALGPLNAALGGYFMVATPTELIGRANSAASVFAMGALPLAPLIAGFGLGLLGRGGTILVGAALCAITAAMVIGDRALRSLPAEAGWAAHAQKFSSPARVPAVTR